MRGKAALAVVGALALLGLAFSPAAHAATATCKSGPTDLFYIVWNPNDNLEVTAMNGTDYLEQADATVWGTFVDGCYNPVFNDFNASGMTDDAATGGVVQEAFPAKNDPHPQNQFWVVQAESGGYQHIVNEYTGQCLQGNGNGRALDMAACSAGGTGWHVEAED